MVVQLPILVGNVNDLLGLGFTRAEVWVSEDQGNSFFEATAAAAQAAVLVSEPATTLFPAGGKLLKFQINEGPEQSVLFDTALANWTPAQIVTAINNVAESLASVSGSSVVLTAPTTGRSSSVRVTYSDCAELGWTGGVFVKGHDARITLVTNTLSYLYTDLSGLDSYLYKWRFSANGLSPFSDYSSPPTPGHQPPVLGSSNVSVCTCKFVGLDGVATQQKIIISQVTGPQAVGGYLIARQVPQILESDDSGYLQFTLVRGAKVRVAIEGTAFVREITVPDTATFDLLAAMTDAPDPFTVQVPPPFLIRRSH